MSVLLRAKNGLEESTRLRLSNQLGCRYIPPAPCLLPSTLSSIRNYRQPSCAWLSIDMVANGASRDPYWPHSLRKTQDQSTAVTVYWIRKQLFKTLIHDSYWAAKPSRMFIKSIPKTAVILGQNTLCGGGTYILTYGLTIWQVYGGSQTVGPV
jgi:hypothetical protein